MAKFEPFIRIDETPATRNNWRLAKSELPKRAAAMARMISYAAAKEIYDSIAAAIPGSDDYRELRRSIKLMEINGTEKGKSAAFAIWINPKGRRIKKIDVAKTVITIQPKRGQKAPPKDVVLLARSGPWTADTIPFWPKKSDAIVVQKKMTKKIADDVAKARKKDLPGIRRELFTLGRKIPTPKPNAPGHLKRNSKAVPDLAMQAMSLEFGGEGVRSHPVFRRSITRTKRSMTGLPTRFVQIKEAMLSPNKQTYKRWPVRQDKISIKKVTDFLGFQKRLGY